MGPRGRAAGLVSCKRRCAVSLSTTNGAASSGRCRTRRKSSHSVALLRLLPRFGDRRHGLPRRPSSAPRLVPRHLLPGAAQRWGATRRPGRHSTCDDSRPSVGRLRFVPPRREHGHHRCPGCVRDAPRPRDRPPSAQGRPRTPIHPSALPSAHTVFGNLKTWLRGTSHGVSPEHFQRTTPSSASASIGAGGRPNSSSAFCTARSTPVRVLVNYWRRRESDRRRRFKRDARTDSDQYGKS